MKKKIPIVTRACRPWRKRIIVITEAQIHQAFHALALAEGKKWVRRENGNTSVRARD